MSRTGQVNCRLIIDSVETDGLHDIALYFHFSEFCRDIKISAGVCGLLLGDDELTIVLPVGMSAETIAGQENENKELPSLGWLSRGYHQKVAISTLVLKTPVTGDSEFKTVITW